MKARVLTIPVVPLFLAALSWSGGDLLAQRFRVEEVADILPGPGSSDPGRFTRLGNDLIFTARDATLLPVQRALFKTDGQTVDRLGEAQYSTNPGFVPYFTELNGELFSPGIGSNGGELYKTDGEQVVEVADINPGSAYSFPYGFARLGEELFFGAGGPNGTELYKTNGTDVIEVADILPGSDGSRPHASSQLGEELVFIADGPNGSEPYKTDGIDVVQLADLNPGPADSFYTSPHLPVFHDIGGRFVFSGMGPGGWGLYSTDGTDVLELNIEPSTIEPHSFASFDDYLFFTANGPDGEELFKTDGLTATQVSDIRPGPSSSSPGPFTEFKGELYFPAYTPEVAGVPDRELYRTDGISVHQVQVADLIDTSWGSQPGDLRAFKDELYFTAVGPAGFDLYKTDGTNLVSLDINPNGGAFFGLPGPVPTGISYTEFNGQLFFKAIGPDGWELFSTDGDSIIDYDVDAFRLTEFNGELFFSGRGPNGVELYKLSVTPEPSSVVLLVVAVLIAVCRLGRPRASGWRRERE